MSPLRHGNKIGPKGHGVSAELVRAVGTQRADDEAAVLEAVPVGRFKSLSVEIGDRVDDRLSALFIPRSEGSTAFANAAVSGENAGREAWPVDRDAACGDAVGVVRVDPCANW